MRVELSSLVLLGCVFIVLNSCKTADRGLEVSNTIIPQSSGELAITRDSHSRSSLPSMPEKQSSDIYTCIPQRVINASVLPGAEFRQVDLMGYEKVALPTGDRLLIINWGRESYNLTFRFETNRFGTDTSKVKQWYSILTQLLYVIEPAVNSPVRIQNGIDEIHNYLNQDTIPVAYNVPLSLNHDSTISDLVFERVKVLGDSAVRLDATFSISTL